jgi:DNA-binding protein H-NS
LAGLARQAEEAKAAEVQAVIDDIRTKVAEYCLTEKDIFGSRHRAQAKRAFTGVPRYRDPKTGAEWTGHGRAPGWIKNVKDRTKFLIAVSAGTATVKHTSRTAASKGAATKKAAAGKVAKTTSAARARRRTTSKDTVQPTTQPADRENT